MKNRLIIGILSFLIIGTILMSGCASPRSTSATSVATPTPQIVYVTVTVTPTETIASQIQTATSVAADPVIGKKWMYDFKVQGYGKLNFRNETMVFTMDEKGKTNGTISSERGDNATITGEWYKDSTTGIYYITPILCMRLTTDRGEVIGPAGESVTWVENAPEIPGENGVSHWCYDSGVIYEMKYMHPNKLVEMSVSNTRTAINGVTFTTN
jgi:hypothetical protein